MQHDLRNQIITNPKIGIVLGELFAGIDYDVLVVAYHLRLSTVQQMVVRIPISKSCFKNWWWPFRFR